VHTNTAERHSASFLIIRNLSKFVPEDRTDDQAIKENCLWRKLRYLSPLWLYYGLVSRIIASRDVIKRYNECISQAYPLGVHVYFTSSSRHDNWNHISQ